MGFLDFLKNNRIPNVEVKENTFYDTDKVGSLEIPDKLTDDNAFVLANTVAEIYHPIDFLADRASKLRFYIADKNGIELENTELNRFITDINPLYSFNELFYQAVFSYLSDGNTFSYLGIPSLYKNPSVNSISRLDILQPNLLCFREYTNLSKLKVSSLTDFIIEAKLAEISGYYEQLEVSKLRINTYDSTLKDSSLILCKSPLFKAYRSINNLLAVYSARYNVYANNGAAGYISKKASGTGLNEAMGDRDEILKDINSRNGITGKRNFWGISGTPIEFVNTLATIKDLLPFDETLENSIKIAATLQIPAGLVPRKDQSTYNNQDADEKKVWENTLISIVDGMCWNFTKNLTLNKVGYSIKADYSNVSALQINKSNIEDTVLKTLNNLEKIKQLSPTTDIQKEIDKIVLGYEQR